MKECTKCSKQYNDTEDFCPECGSELTAVKAAVPAPSAPPSAIEGFLSKTWPLLLGIVGYAVSWWMDGVFGIIIGLAAAVACWMKSSGKPICSSMVVKILTTILGIINLAEAFKYM